MTEYLGELNVALDLYTQLARLEPDNPEHLLRAAAIQIRRNNPTSAMVLLRPIPVRFKNDADALIATAQLLVQAGRPAEEALPLAYRARRLALHDPDTHIAYVSLFLRAEPESGTFNPQSVEIGTSVRLAGGETGWFTILEDEPVDLGRGELLHTNPLAKKLLGRKPGDSVAIRQGIAEEPRSVIAEIQSRFVRAFQDTLDRFGLLFPGHIGIQRVAIEEGDPAKFLAVTEQHIRLAEMVRDAYLEKGMPLGAFARLVGRSLTEVYIGLVNGDGKLRAAAGTKEEQAAQSSLLSATETITLELTALLTLGYLDLLEIPLKRIPESPCCPGSARRVA